jgi:hypothetical protein
MRVIISILFLALCGCKTNSKMIQPASEKQNEFVPVFASGPPILVYKTKSNYNNLVPVILSDDKSKIVSYPHPKDLKIGDRYLLPYLLKNGYMLDNRGIGKNVAFLKLNYEEYARLENAPSLEELYKLIVDKDPLTELCNCGIKTAFTDPVLQINEIIVNNRLRTICKVIK